MKVLLFSHRRCCTNCGLTVGLLRSLSQAEFRCKKCGFECHADYNAAVNIRADYLKLRAASIRLLWSAQKWEFELQAPSPCGWDI
ncbi:zinc ribbon domain-containing protein [Nostoc sp. TCL240-02]|uniref:zinc ribbon domain-containing protein n=1 Tax=Nostoc sp. TCL240-02 TaxID=2572090 RepID=UPI00157FB79A